MHRRDFLKQGGGALALAALPIPVSIAARAQPRPLRVGLIGTGWFGKADLLRLIQVAPVEVVSLCDVDTQMPGPPRSSLAARPRRRHRAPIATTA
jgi:hypothetical protein